jgi:hypothetical protein
LARINRQREEPDLNGRRQPACDGTSRMTRECQVRICERLGVKLPGPTRQVILVDRLASLGGMEVMTAAIGVEARRQPFSMIVSSSPRKLEAVPSSSTSNAV